MEHTDSRLGIAVAHAELSARQLAQSSYGPALGSIVTALRFAPGMAQFWAQFSELVRYFNFRHPVDPQLRELLSRALEHPAVDPGNLVRPITSIALSRPAGEALQDPLLLRMLEDALARDPVLENLIVSSRRTALKRVFDDPALALPAIAAIAHQCFNTEYLAGESADETEEVERLRVTIGSAQPVPVHWYAVYACYRPLHTLEGAERIASELAQTPLASLARRQILEPLEERALRETIVSMTGTGDRISAAVQTQYESNPYPRWLRTQTSFVAGSLAEIPRELFPHADLEGVAETRPRILVAGCGTGQNSIATARRFRDPSVLAVDLSLASLAYAKRKTLELKIEGIEYRQADILALGELRERFDLIECSGVLHHLEDPFAGWQVLASLLEARGLMRIGLYSEAGRRHVVRARALIASEGFASSAEGIRRCRAAILARMDDELLARIARSEDFFSMSGCRDLMFHAQEHRFSLPEIAAMIERLGMRFLGFEFPDGGATAARYRTRFPDDRALVDLRNWHSFEQENPDSFARMYQFWVRKPG